METQGDRQAPGSDAGAGCEQRELRDPGSSKCTAGAPCMSAERQKPQHQATVTVNEPLSDGSVWYLGGRKDKPLQGTPTALLGVRSRVVLPQAGMG